MAFMRSQLSLVLLLAVVCAVTAKEVSVQEWQGDLKGNGIYDSWCLHRERLNCIRIGTSESPSLNLTDRVCNMLYKELNETMFGLISSPGAEVQQNINGTIVTTEFCIPVNDTTSIPTIKTGTTSDTTVTEATGNNATTDPSTTFLPAPQSSSDDNAPRTPAATGTSNEVTVPTLNTEGNNSSVPEVAKDSSPSTEPTADIPEGAESGETNHLYWILPVIAIVLVAMVVGGIYIHRYAKKSGYHHSSKTNGDAAKGTGESA